MDDYDLSGALEQIWEVVRGLNRHVESTAPWALAKDETKKAELDEVLYDLVDGLRAVAISLAAFIPTTSAQILAALQQPETLAWGGVEYGQGTATSGVEATPPLFPRLESPVAVE